MLRRHFLLSAAAGRNYLVYWGTYTAGGPRYGTGESKGIYVSRLNAATGQLTPPQVACEAANPSYIAVHPNRKFLYSVNEHIEMDGKAPGEVSAFAINPQSGQLTPLNRVSSHGGMPCHVAVDASGRTLAVANWATGSVASFPIRSDGSLAESTGFYQHIATGAAKVHCHAVVFSPDNRYLIETDTGLNSIFVHRLNAVTAAIVPHRPPSLHLENAASPRHLVFHPNGRWAYVANESGPGCTMLEYDRRRGGYSAKAQSPAPSPNLSRAAPPPPKPSCTPAAISSSSPTAATNRSPSFASTPPTARSRLSTPSSPAAPARAASTSIPPASGYSPSCSGRIRFFRSASTTAPEN